MNGIKKSLFSFWASRINSQKLYDSVHPVVIHPFYHTVTDENLPHLNNLYKPKTTKAFRDDIEYLMQYFRPVSISDVYIYHKKEQNLTNRSFHLSFDDGLKEVYTNLLPYLYEKGIPATLFVNAAFVDNKNMFYRHKASLIIEKIKSGNFSEIILKEIKEIHFPDSKQNIQADILSVKYKQKEKLDSIAGLIDLDFEDYLKKEQPYLTSEQLLEMQCKGFTIGSHTLDHPFLPELDKKEQIKQIIESVLFIKEKFNATHSFFSFPFSDEAVEKSVFEAIYPIVDLSFGITGLGTRFEGKHIARINMEKYGKNTKEAINKAYLKFKLNSI